MAKREILIHKGKLDNSIPDYFNDVYVLDDDRVIVQFGTHAYEYKSVNELKNWVVFLKEKQTRNPVSHILTNRLLWGDKFISHVKELSNRVFIRFKLSDNLSPIDKLKKVDSLILKERDTIKLDEEFFSSMVAFVGEAMIGYFGGEEWTLKKDMGGTETWEPYISFNGKLYNPFFLVYKELCEEFLETNKIDFCRQFEWEVGK